MSTKQTTKEETAKEPIIRGRIPHVIVQLIRFNDTHLTVVQKASLYNTTVGKISDILKNRNFAYIAADTKFTVEQKDQGLQYAALNSDKENGEMIANAIKALPTATEQEAAAFDAVKKRAAPETQLSNEGGKPAGGGNRRGQGRNTTKDTAEDETVEAVEDEDTVEDLSADELLGI